MLILLSNDLTETQKTILDPSFNDYTLFSKEQLIDLVTYYFDLLQKRTKQVCIYEDYFKILQKSHKQNNENKKIKKLLALAHDQEYDICCNIICEIDSKHMEFEIYDLATESSLNKIKSSKRNVIH